MTVKMTIPNLARFKKGFQSFPLNLARRTLNQSLKKAGTILLDETKAEVPVDTGDLRDSLGGRAKKISDFESNYFVESTHEKGKGAWHAALVEYGHRWVIMRGKKVLRTGMKPPNPFMRPAFDTKKNEMIEEIATTIDKAAGRLWKRLGDG